MGRSAWPLLAALALALLLLTASLREGGSGPASRKFEATRRREEMRGKDDLNYGIIVDAGSSGSRGFVYIWPPHSGDPHQLLRIEPLTDDVGYPVVKKIKPGLSSMAESPQNATSYMRPLLDYLCTKIPAHKHKETSLFILATAGLRLIAEQQREAILSNLRQELPKSYDFIVMDQHIQMISGKWEGIYSWIAVNYALDRLSAPRNNSSEPKTVGMIDMGGGSMQIAFELKDPLPSEVSHHGHTINLGCMEHDEEHEYRLYVTTFLGFGANAALQRYEDTLYNEAAAVKRAKRQTNLNDSVPDGSPPVMPPPELEPITPSPGPNSSWLGEALPDPCLPLNLVQPLRPSGTIEPNEGPMRRRGTGDFPACLRSVRDLLNKEKECEAHPCSMDGRHQPPISPAAMFYGFSEYWYSYNDILGLGSKWDLEALIQRQTEFCGDKWALTKDRFHRKLYPKADMDRLRTQCFKGAWIAAVLHDGFGFPKQEPHFRSAQTLRGQEVQWTLGAILYKLRYFPLREIQRLRDEAAQEHRHGGSLLPSSWLGQGLLLLCILVVMGGAGRLAYVLHRGPVQSIPAFRRSNTLWGRLTSFGGGERDRRSQGQVTSFRRTSSAAGLLQHYDKRDYVY